MPLDRAAYAKARDRIDRVITKHADEISADLVLIAHQRSLVMFEFANRWLVFASKNGCPEANNVNARKFARKMGLAYIDVLKSAFHYRFANSLKKNMNLRKILSMEYWAFHKHGILVEPIGQFADDGSGFAAVFRQYPLASLFAFRILSEMGNAQLGLDHALKSADLLKRIVASTYSGMHQFARTHGPSLTPHSMREFLEGPGGNDLSLVVTVLEKFSKDLVDV